MLNNNLIISNWQWIALSKGLRVIRWTSYCNHHLRIQFWIIKSNYSAKRRVIEIKRVGSKQECEREVAREMHWENISKSMAWISYFFEKNQIFNSHTLPCKKQSEDLKFNLKSKFILYFCNLSILDRYFHINFTVLTINQISLWHREVF